MAIHIAIIGAGPGGYVAAIRAAQLGADVTLIEKESVGGTCLNWGCIPSKVLIRTAGMLETFHQAGAFGIDWDGTARVDMARLMARKEAVIATQARGIHGLLKQRKVRYLAGTAHIEGPGRLRVMPSASGEDANAEAEGKSDTAAAGGKIETAGGKTETAGGKTGIVEWDRLIIATGTRPLEIKGFAFDGESVLSSNHALALKAVPRSVMIVGGGVIGCEFACILSGLGAQVKVVEGLDRLLPLPSVDEACSRVLQREFKKRKIAFMLNKTVESFERGADGLTVTVGASPFLAAPSEKDRRPVTVAVEKMLVCVGRKANSDGLGLETIGVVPDERGWIPVDDRMRAAAENVYAIGDILGPSHVMLAHVASVEGEVAAENAVAGGDRQMDYTAVPGAIFTTPEVANVGLSEAGAAAAGYSASAECALFRTLGKAQVLGEIAGEAKIVWDTATGKVLGVHIVGPHATDLIAEATLAIRMGATVADIAHTIHAHPTLAEIMLEGALKATGRPLHA